VNHQNLAFAMLIQSLFFKPKWCRGFSHDLKNGLPKCALGLAKWAIGPLHDPVTWYKITHAGEQVAQWDFQNNATRTSPPGPAFILEVPLHNLLTSMCDFVSCDQIVQRAYWRLSCKKGDITFWANFYFLQDRANFWQTDLFWHEEHRCVIDFVDLRFVFKNSVIYICEKLGLPRVCFGDLLLSEKQKNLLFC